MAHTLGSPKGTDNFHTLWRIKGSRFSQKARRDAPNSSPRPIPFSSTLITFALMIVLVSLSLATIIQPAFAPPPYTSELIVSNIIVTPTGPSTANVAYTATVLVDGAALPANQVVCTPPSGSSFSAGDVNVGCTFDDTSGQQVSLQFKIRVDPTAPTTTTPVITPNPTNIAPTVTASATDSGAATSTITAAEFFIDSIGANGAGTAMTASDGSFNSNSEGLTATMSAAVFNALSQGSHTIYVHAKDGAGNWGTTTSATFVKDTAAPTATSVSSTLANGAYSAGTIPITITFSEAVTVTGIPQLLLETGTTDSQATYASGTGTATLTFNYGITAGDTSADLNYVATTSLALNGGTIKDATTNNAVLTLPTPGGANSLGSNKDIVIDTTAPTVSSVIVNKILIKESDVGTNAFQVTVTFSEVMKNTINPTITFIPAVGVTSAPITLTTGTGSVFSGGNIIYTSIYNIVDNNAQVADIDVQVTNGQDAAGNVQTSATPADLFDIDTAGPVAPVINVPAASASVNSATPTVSGTADAGSTVTVKEGLTTLGTAIATGGSWSLTSSSLVDGPHTITATATDTAGNPGPASAGRTFTVDTVVPSTTTPVITPNPTNTAPTITATATDAAPSSNVAQAEYFIDTAGAGGTGIAMSALDGLFNSASEGITATMSAAAFNALPQDTHTIYVHAKDAAGNWETTASATFVKDTVAPTVIASPVGGTYGSTQSVTLTASETATLYYTTDGTTPTTSSPTYSTPIAITSTTTLKYFAKDAAGNAGTVQTQTYTIDSTPPTVTASPVGGTYNAAQSVTLTASEPSTIYFTTNGADPTTASPVYSTPISITTTTTLKYLPKDTVGNLGTIQSQVYTIDTTAPTVTASPLGGIYNTAQSVTLTANEAATIYYTTNGSTPTTSSPVYSTPIALSSTTTLKYFGKDTAGNSGTVQTQVYTIDTVAPTVAASPAGGLYNTPKSVTLTSSETGTTIYYTTDGTTPTTSSPVYSTPISISATTTLKFFGKDAAGNSGTVVTEQYTIDTVAPTASATPTGGTYGSVVSVTLTASEAGTIYYTTDGTTPTTSSPTYSSPLQISTTTTLKFFGKDNAGNSGTVVTENYVIDTSDPVVTASPPGGIFNTAQSVTLTASETATIYYTTNGNIPTTSSSVYSSPISVTATTTLKFFGVDAVGNAGTIATEVYTIDTVAPTTTASPTGGTFASSQSVILSANEGGSLIYYTTDGADPDLSSPVYTSAIQLTSSTTLKFYGRDAAGNFGVIVTENYVIDTSAPTVVASPLGGSYNAAQTVTLTASEPATIYYTTNGSTPTTSSPAYSTPLAISATTTLKFFAVDTLGNSGPVQTEQYNIDTTAPIVTASPAGGLYNTAQSVTLTASETATIYYTTNGATPTTSSSVYSSPISISATTTLKYFAKDTAGNSGTIQTQVYTIDTTAPTVSASPIGGTFGPSGTSVTLTASETATIYYTTNGATPTTSSSVYSSPISISATTTLKYFAKDTAGNSGTVQTQTYTIDAIPPTATASPAGGLYNTAKTITLAASEPATIYYSTDGTTPTEASSQYTSPIVISTTTTLKFFAKDSFGNSGTLQTETYTIDTVAPTVSASPAGGTYGSTQSVSLTASETATLYYTTDGSTPTTLSTTYSSAISISTTTTLKFFGKDTAGNSGTVVTQNYIIDSDAPTVSASPLGGSFNTAQSVTLTASETATIYYTTNGSTPTTSSPVYSAPISITSTTTLKFFAVDTLGNSGAVQTEQYTIDTVAPTVNASPAGGLFNTVQTVTLTASEPATIYYTTNGATPTTSSSVYSSPISISATTTLKYFAKDTAGNSGTVQTQVYTIDTTPPTVTASPIGGTFGPSGTSVTLTSNEAATIYYTTDGTTPTPSSSTYTTPISISATTTLKYFGKDTAGNSGTVQTQTYTIDSTAPTVTASPVGGLYNTAKTVALTASETGTTIYYTTDGTTPTEASNQYASPILISTTTTLKFFGKDAFGNSGTVQTQVYTIDTVAPTVSATPSGGTFGSGLSVTLTASEPATIYYTTNGATPTTSSPTYSSPISISATTTLKFFGKDTGGNSGAVVTENYVIDTSAPTVTASPLGGSYTNAQSVTLTASEPSAIYYTTDGSTPSTSSSVYSSALLISTTTTLKFFAVDAQNNSGIVQTQVYTIDTIPPTVSASPAGGVYNAAQSVTLTSSESSTIYYTTNGATPTTSSPTYSSPISISATTTLKFFGKDIAGNSGTIVTEQYTIDTTPPTVTALPLGGTFGPSGTSVTLTASETATIYYTTNGATPTTSSSVYSSPISISATTTLKYFAKDTAGNSGTVQTQVYTIDNTPPVATASPVGGTYSSIQSVTLSSSESGSTIYYTIDSSTPSTSSSVYASTPISVNVNKVIKFFAVDSFGNTGGIVTATYVLTGTTLQSATGTGTIALSTNTGSFEAVSAISESSLPTSGKPAGITFPHGFVSFVVTGIPSGSSITLTQTYPTAVPPNSQYWTVIGGTWTDLTTLVGSNNGDNIITLTLSDGGLGDEDGLANGRIADPSGSGLIADSTPPTVTASPTGGTYSSTQSVILSANEPGTAIYYTTNGATPTTSSPQYSGVPISISTDTTLKFFGKDPAGNNSPVSTEVYDINPAPAIVMQDTTGTTGQSLYSGRQIFAEYATPTSTLIGKSIDSITIALKKSGTPAGTAQIGVINPDLSMKKVFATLTVNTLTTSYTDNEYKLPAGEVYTIQSGDRIGIKYTGSTSSSSNNISIMRDTNTADPFDGTNSHMTYYTSSWAMSGTALTYDLKMTLKYSGGGSGGSDTTAPTVSASPVGGSYNTAQLVSLTANEPATVYYTLDGSTPTTSSSVYTGSPLSITTTTTLKFFGKDTAGNSGSVLTQVYTIDTTPPTVSASPPGGSYASVQTVTLTSSESGTTIYYTTNGASPTTSSPVYSAPIQLTSTTTLKFFGKDTAGNSGGIVTVSYTITIPDTTPPTITASPVGGTFGPSGTSVTLSANEPATIYYTTNGDTPTESSTTYTSPISITTTTTLKYFGKDTAGNPSGIQSQTYTIDTTPPTVSAAPLGNSYTSSQSVTLGSSESGTVIRYTTNGIDPTGASPQYSSPISISTDTTLKFYGTDSFGNAGSIVTEIYDITAPPQPPGIVMQDTTTGGTGWGIYSTRPVLSEYVSSTSVLVGKQIDSITVNIKKSESTAVGTAQIGIINSDLSMKKVFANIDISTLTTSYVPKEFLLPSGENYILEAGDRIGIKYTGGSSSGGNYIAIMRDINTSDPYDGANTYLSYYTSSWTAQTTYDLVMTLKLID